jgi:hypothetical protein
MGDPVHQVLNLVGYGHDLLEDTTVTFEVLRALLGPEAAWLVRAVTLDPGSGANRKEWFAASYPVIARMPWAVVPKLADRIANWEACFQYGPERKLLMYRGEYPDFRAALWREPAVPAPWDQSAGGGGGRWVAEMWRHLDDLMARSMGVQAGAAEDGAKTDSGGDAIQPSLF